ncbi:hypothetical protein AA103196_2956 [Ameyamaea chiangmaiensis NBRC 103196]|uniref:CsbD family protein n=1 Tax=Ameyamaea chiangmaiensis TaxID=442969 RepID=A0A850PF64_9PROT|nr:CsbD family protein [Ameyamaea chiangmaiensis]MBS4074445.1 CsbD family protein [Ameyamaea chiangmaiensis]NVN41100.1 CsbD family protein [Ameyamaea chiangmaiensis]GBQ72065.1 hypothetical protein AA103196_2956 [Ameyamaea chiangmaiensis NBRC 103196]
MADDKIDTTAQRAQGFMDEVKGRVKDGVGGLAGDIGLQAEGKFDQLAGVARQEFADLYDEGNSRLEQAVALVKDRPLASLGVVAVAGILLGWLFFPRRKG